MPWPWKGAEEMDILWAFIIGGIICVIGQLLFDIAKLTPGHTLVILVVSGSILGGFGIYPALVDFAGAGATLPISSFGNSLLQGALEGAAKDGFWGLWEGILGKVSSGVSAAIIFAFLTALVFNPKS